MYPSFFRERSWGHSTVQAKGLKGGTLLTDFRGYLGVLSGLLRHMGTIEGI